MENNQLVLIDQVCVHYEVELNFIDSLEEYGLIQLVVMDNTKYLSPDDLHLEAHGDRAVDVLPRERLRRRAEHGDFGRTGSHRGGEALQVRHQHRIGHPRLAPDTRHHVRAVRHLRDPLRRHERGRLDRRQPRVREAFDQRDLDVGGDGLRFVLQAVARADLDDLDVLGDGAHRWSRQQPLTPALSPHARRERCVAAASETRARLDLTTLPARGEREVRCRRIRGAPALGARGRRSGCGTPRVTSPSRARSRRVPRLRRPARRRRSGTPSRGRRRAR